MKSKPGLKYDRTSDGKTKKSKLAYMEEKILFLSFAFSLGALSLSAYTFSNQYYADIPTTVLTLVGICATLIVGISVVDAFAVHNALEKYETKMNELTIRMEALTKLEETVHKMKKQTNILFHHTWGLSFSDKQPYAALAEFWNAFQLAAKEDDVKRAKSCLENAQTVIHDIIERKTSNRKLDSPDMDKLPTDIPNDLKNSKVYIAFKNSVDELIDDIITITKQLI